ncbi:hypothetical protein [Hymenobacter metallicola]|uniref:Uncharacterized protein n=1 Tax=Hymenobacter metallicola TaxID=2563114 RepID=A0A4Z0QDV6_9BACT|nr:hypothetical protein [Hymenobacter metallicola]TGE28240.1 hypothetical protein E5K02_01890 [Hymenobacter metallicola]
MQRLSRTASTLVALLLMGFAAPQGPTAPQTAEAGSTIKLLALNQPPCATLSRESVVTAKLRYQLAPQEQSAEGFVVSIKFQSTNPKMTFSSTQLGRVKLTQRADTLTLRYPMAAVWNNPQLRRPLTCYFYLHRNLGNGRSTVIAQTPPIVFTECQ